MPHTRANRIRRLQEELRLAREDRRKALDERDAALARLRVLQADRQLERLAARVCDKRERDLAHALLRQIRDYELAGPDLHGAGWSAAITALLGDFEVSLGDTRETTEGEP